MYCIDREGPYRRGPWLEKWNGEGNNFLEDCDGLGRSYAVEEKREFRISDKHNFVESSESLISFRKLKRSSLRAFGSPLCPLNVAHRVGPNLGVNFARMKQIFLVLRCSICFEILTSNSNRSWPQFH